MGVQKDSLGNNLPTQKELNDGATLEEISNALSIDSFRLAVFIGKNQGAEVGYNSSQKIAVIYKKGEVPSFLVHE